MKAKNYYSLSPDFIGMKINLCQGVGVRLIKGCCNLTIVFIMIFLLLIIPKTVISQDEETELEEAEYTEPADFQWHTPAGSYLDPASFFSLHGFVNGVYGSSSKDWKTTHPTKLAAPGQPLVPNTANSSFTYDGAIIIGSELSERLNMIIEMHFLSDPSGKGAAGPLGLTIAVTEAAVSYEVIPKYLTISSGIYWIPFGIVNQDWMGSKLFNTLPRAMGVIPTHYNERGIRLNGEHAFSDKAGFNYVFSYGNGVSKPNIKGIGSFDNNENKTIAGRLGIFPGLGNKLDVGISFLSGQFRSSPDTTLGITDVERYAADMNAFGFDAIFKQKGFKLRGYYNISTETLVPIASDSTNLQNIPRNGAMLEVSYLIKINKENFYGITPKFRLDNMTIGTLNIDGSGNLELKNYDATVISLGVNLNIHEKFQISFDYNIPSESGQTDLANNRFYAKFTAEF